MKKCFIELYLKKRGSQFSGDVNIISLLNEKGKYLNGERKKAIAKDTTASFYFMILKDFTKTIDGCC